MNVRILFLYFILIATALMACSKASDDVFMPPRTTTIAVINAGPDTLNVYQRGTRLNSGSNLLPGGQYTGLQVSIGTGNFQFKKAGRAEVLIDVPLTIDTSANYTLFVGGQSADKVFLLRDTLPKRDTTYIRFVNASPIENSLEVSVGSNFNYQKVAFKTATSFIPVIDGKVALRIKETGGTKILAEGNLTLTKNYVYTLFTKGVLNGIGTNAFGARILVTRQ